MKSKFMLCALIILSVVFFFNCQNVELFQEKAAEDTARGLAAEVENNPVLTPLKERLIKDTGVIKYINLEGGFYGIIGRKGHYDPINLPREFQQDGLKVQFVAKLRTDLASFHMWGKIIEIISMRTTDSGKKLIMDVGVINHYMIQGGPWTIKATTDEYQALNLPPEFRFEGMKVSFVGLLREDIIIIPALWPLVEILSIKAISGGPINVNLNEEFKLPVGRSALVEKDQVLLTFKSVLSDSRCPEGVVCVWAGEATVLVNVKIAGQDYGDFKMTTLDSPSIIRVDKYFIRFFNLYPYPVYSQPTDPADYVGIFMIGLLPPTPPPPIPVNLNEQFKLPVGRSALVVRDQVLLSFKSVLSDSRCPKGVECFWQGEATVLVNVKIAGTDYGDYKMTTLDSPSVIRVGRYYIQFYDLYPYPVYTQPTDPADYVGIFMISSLPETTAEKME